MKRSIDAVENGNALPSEDTPKLKRAYSDFLTPGSADRNFSEVKIVISMSLDNVCY